MRAVLWAVARSSARRARLLLVELARPLRRAVPQLRRVGEASAGDHEAAAAIVELERAEARRHVEVAPLRGVRNVHWAACGRPAVGAEAKVCGVRVCACARARMHACLFVVAQREDVIRRVELHLRQPAHLLEQLGEQRAALRLVEKRALLQPLAVRVSGEVDAHEPRRRRRRAATAAAAAARRARAWRVLVDLWRGGSDVRETPDARGRKMQAAAADLWQLRRRRFAGGGLLHLSEVEVLPAELAERALALDVRHVLVGRAVVLRHEQLEVLRLQVEHLQVLLLHVLREHDRDHLRHARALGHEHRHGVARDRVAEDAHTDQLAAPRRRRAALGAAVRAEQRRERRRRRHRRQLRHLLPLEDVRRRPGVVADEPDLSHLRPRRLVRQAARRLLRRAPPPADLCLSRHRAVLVLVVRHRRCLRARGEQMQQLQVLALRRDRQVRLDRARKSRGAREVHGRAKEPRRYARQREKPWDARLQA